MKGLSPQTEAVFEQISKLECIKDYTLIGGTALSLQLGHRLSEDLDFCRWHKHKREKLWVNWRQIQEELSKIGTVKRNLLAETQCDFLVDGVKITFLDDNKFKEPPMFKKIPFLNNLKLADIGSIGTMKLEVMSRRSTYRDFYDLYCILKTEKVVFDNIIKNTGNYTNHDLSTKGMFITLARAGEVKIEKSFLKLMPVYDIPPSKIQQFFMENAQQYVMDNNKQNKTSLTSIIERVNSNIPKKTIPNKLKNQSFKGFKSNDFEMDL